ncbi:major facilitator superfamily domain-containing protein 6-like [Physella acuta]|uniref:major facilitator superfamily domain-containing protein 6-like n=1 Tax=Physella acuta TaxID=109671 RepID=UPI0027DB2F9E|nr:major facilitator superfamily domain-containing protein 6-like [Physella acuta]XP_059141567.1 major facilitator superfamily domain-containing protein 6-like [Physella acuta]
MASLNNGTPTHPGQPTEVHGKKSSGWKINKKLLPLKIFYFFFYGASGSVIPFVSVYLKHLRLNVAEAGLITGSAVLLAMCVRPLFGMAADRFGAWKTLLALCNFGFGIAYFCMIFVPVRFQAFGARNESLPDANASIFHQEPWSHIWTCYSAEGAVICSYPQHLDHKKCHVYENDVTSVEETGFQSFNASNKIFRQGKNISANDHYIGLMGSSVSSAESSELNLSSDGKSMYQKQADEKEMSTYCFYLNSDTSVTPDFSGNHLLDKETLKTTPEIPTDKNTNNILSSGKRKNYNRTNNMVRRSYPVWCLPNCTKYILKYMTGTPETELFTTTKNPFIENSGNYGSIVHDFAFVISFLLITIARSFYAASSSLADAVTYTVLGPRSHRWGQQRLWGTLGTALAVLATMVLNDRLKGDNFSALFAVCLGLSVFASVITGTTMKAQKIPEKRKLCSDVTKVLSNSSVRLFLAKLLFFGIMCGTVNNFFLWFLVDLGADQTILGLVVMTHCLSSVSTLGNTGRILKRIGPNNTMYVALVAYVIRYFTFSLLTSPWAALPVELLHGLTYSMFWAAASSTASRAAPPGTQGTCQGIAGAVYWDLGRGLGSLITGQILDTLGPRWTFRGYSVICAALLPLFVIADHIWPNRKFRTRETLAVKNLDEEKTINSTQI